MSPWAAQLSPDAPALLLTDNNALRKVASLGELAGLIGPAYTAQHILGAWVLSCMQHRGGLHPCWSLPADSKSKELDDYTNV